MNTYGLRDSYCLFSKPQKPFSDFVLKVLLAVLFFIPIIVQAQVSPVVAKKTKDHNKQVIGYFTQWGPWKDIPGLIPKGSFVQLNIDYSQYTILNYSFFGVAVDGSVHSGDYRNPNIAQPGQVQQPAPLINTDIYSSWDMYLLYGELDVLYHVADGSYAYSLGYRNEGGGWKNINTGETGAFPLSVHKQGGAKGLFDLCKENNVKLMASIGGWSMCKHYPEMAADPVKRKRFVEDCKKLIAKGFDGIDLDWEYPGYEGMNFTGTTADFTNFAILIEEIRAAIGPDKLITSCFTASPAKLKGTNGVSFNWARISNTLNYFNMMTYDYNGGWSNKAGHNSPLYDYPNAENANFSADATMKAAIEVGIPKSKLNIGVGFYGRGVITNGPAALHAPTVKRQETVQPDGNVMTAADFTNWPKDVWDGTPNYQAILANTKDWTEHWDDNAKVPYKTKGNYFLSYDNERSVGEKAKYAVDNGLAGAIVWSVNGDWIDLASSVIAKGKLMYCPNTKAPLVNKINEVFASIPTATVSITSPANGAAIVTGSDVNITASASVPSPSTITKVEFFRNGVKLGEDLSAPYSYLWVKPADGTYSLTAKATDSKANIVTSSTVTISVGPAVNKAPVASITSPADGASFTTTPATINITATASDDEAVAKVEFYNGTAKLGEDLTTPYSFSWSNVAAGTYSLTAVAIDNKGLKGTSAAVKVTVGGSACTTPAWVSTTAYNGGAEVSRGGNKYQAKWWTQGNDPLTNSGPDGVWKLLGTCGGGTSNIAPSVNISSPANGASYTTAPATISITANASDSDGSITKVEFFNGSTKLGEDLTSPYSYSWSNVAAGTYSLTAKATDNGGAVTTSAVVSVSVKSSSTGSCTGKPQYVENGGYVAGSQVQNGGSLYECKPYPSSGWCNGASWAYAPGTGTYWQDAWTLKGACTTTTASVEDEEMSSSRIAVYPNPLIEGGKLTISLDQVYNKVDISVFSITGGKAYNYSFKDKASIELTLPSLPKGVFFIRIAAGDKIQTKKLLLN